MILAHFPRCKDFKFEHKIYTQPEFNSSFLKPNGFWLSGKTSEEESEFEWAWADFCNREFSEWNISEENTFLFEIDLKGVKVISNEKEFEEFEKEYMYVLEITPFGGFKRLTYKPELFKKFKGLAIPNYIWNKRMVADWYYTWDVASAVIWNTNGVLKQI